MLEEMKADIEKVVEIYKNSLAKNDLAGCHEAEARIKAMLKDYKKQALNETLYAIKKTEHPMRTAASMACYDTLKFKRELVDGVEIGAYLTPSTETLNLVEVATYCGLPTLWKYELEKFAQLLAVKISEDLNTDDSERTKAENARIKAKYRMSTKAREIEDGADPTSKTQMIARLQRIMDAAFGGEGMVIVTKDFNFIYHAFDKLDNKKMRTLSAGTVKLMQNLFMHVANAKVGDGTYNVAIKESRAKSDSAPKATDATSAPAAETATDTTAEAPADQPAEQPAA